MQPQPSGTPRRVQAPSDPRRVVLIHPGALGDLLQAIPALAAVRAGWRAAHVTLVTDASLAPVVLTLGLVDATIALDLEVAYHGSVTARAALLARLVAALRSARPDVTAVFKGAGVYAALAASSGAARRVGLVRGGARRLLTDPIELDGARHREDRYADVVRALGLDPGERAEVQWPRVAPPLPAGPAAPSRWLVVAPGGARNAKEAMPSRRWPADRFARVAGALLDRDAALGAVLLGGATDRGAVETVAGALPPARTVNLVGATDLFAARAVIAAGAAYLGNDSGLMHLAATTSTPTVVVFGPTDPRVAAPRTPCMRALWTPIGPTACVDDATGRHRPCVTPCCVERVSEAAVIAAVHDALSGHDGSAAGHGSPSACVPR